MCPKMLMSVYSIVPTLKEASFVLVTKDTYYMMMEKIAQVPNLIGLEMPQGHN